MTLIKYLSSLFFLLCFGHVYAQGQDLEFYLPEHEVVWLQQDGQEAQYLAIQLHKQQPLRQGKMVFLPEWGLHPYQSSLIRTLYHAMPSYGWDTLALQAPTFDLSQISWQEEQERMYPSGNQEAIPLLAQTLLPRLQAAQDYKQHQPGFTLVVAEGITAGVLTHLYTEGTIPLPDAFIVINGYFPQWQLNRSYTQQLANLTFPILDIQSSTSNSWSYSQAQQRQTEMNITKHPAYRQLIVKDWPSMEENEVFIQQVYGWLRSERF